MARFADVTLTAFSSGLDSSNRNVMPMSHPASNPHDSQPATIHMGNFDSHDWASADYQSSGPNAMASGLTGGDGSSTDVYWFWNTVWNENREHPNTSPKSALADAWCSFS